MSPTPVETRDTKRLAAEFLRAVRAKRSQAMFAKRVGYASNVAHNWENRRSAPSAARTFAILQRLGWNVTALLRPFFRLPPEWLGSVKLDTPKGAARLLQELQGQQSTQAIAEQLGKSRFTIARWLAGTTEPKLPEFFSYLECCTLRLPDFLALFIDPAQLPSIAPEWLRLQAARDLAYAHPWTQAVLRALELREYQAKLRSAEWLARRIGIQADQVTTCLEQLAASGQVQWDGKRWQQATVRAIDIGRDPKRAQALRGWWAHKGIERAEAGAPGLVYNLFGVSQADLGRLRALQRNYLAEVRNLVSASEPVECVVLAVDLLLDLEAPTPT